MGSTTAVEPQCSSGFTSAQNILQTSTVNFEQSVDSHDDADTEFSLPRENGGKDAWIFLAACFIMEALVWGVPFSFGVFQDYYQVHEPFSGASGIQVIGTCCLGVMYLSTPPIMNLQRRYQRACFYTPSIGLIALCVSMLAASFSQRIWHLIITQGVMYGLAGAICYYPCLFYLEEWFVRHKGLAYGIMWSGSGIGGFAIPIVLKTFLSMWGFRTALRIWAVAMFVITAPTVCFIKHHLPIQVSAHGQAYNLGFFFDRTFLFYGSANLVQGIGYFLPSIFLPTYARVFLNTSPFLSALTVILVNIASIFGVVVAGFLSDKLHPTTCIFISTTGLVASILLVWGFAANLTILYVFCILYGFFAGSYVSSWPAIMKQITSDYTT
ncbi:hypothetical protein FANTH_14009 [Fusarium anthophilum]|uniref:Major facilitator superfamily (MFS) profile domain-containing protein n=1 Tax=Fusarium anthophilum TaxID=48485 RepID=A0A8H5DNH5_9HYPO|nr:hypothetical protein FANTH_14009 [Fusarium anthophilum]